MADVEVVARMVPLIDLASSPLIFMGARLQDARNGD
jgi:hypothetical protein